MVDKANVHGTIYLNKNRWWWKVRLPNQDKPKAIPLKPDGAKFATRDYDVACAVAESLWRKAMRGEQDQPVNLKDTSIKALIPRYLAYCRGYYRKSREAYPKNAAQLHGKYDKDSYRRAVKHAIKAAKGRDRVSPAPVAPQCRYLE